MAFFGGSPTFLDPGRKAFRELHQSDTCKQLTGYASKTAENFVSVGKSALKVVGTFSQAGYEKTRDKMSYKLGTDNFLPLFKEEEQLKQKKEEEFHKKFWSRGPCPDVYPQRSEILKQYKAPQDDSYPLSLKSGKNVCMIASKMETHLASKQDSNPITMFYFSGNRADRHNSIYYVYPYLERFMRIPARIFFMSPYDIVKEEGAKERYFPLGGIVEIAEIMYKTMGYIKTKYGYERPDIGIGHSFGGITCGEMFKHCKVEELPRVMCIGSTPSSISDSINSFKWNLGPISIPYLIEMIPVAKATGWATDVHVELDKFVRAHKEELQKQETTIVCTGVKEDFYFKDANLINSRKVKDLQKEGRVVVLKFDFPTGLHSERGHHDLAHQHLKEGFLVTKKEAEKEEAEKESETSTSEPKTESTVGFMEEGENVADTLVRYSLKEHKMREVTS
ncbi:MAG TPA: hypothetical protein VGJ00_09030 [Rhabdochlamydiaceae bacterium]